MSHRNLSSAGMSGVLGLLLPRVALAHPGHHGQMSVAQAVRHVATQPDHLALVAVGVVVMALGAARVLAPVRK